MKKGEELAPPIPLLSRHAVVGTWMDSDPDGSSCRFTVRPAARGTFAVTAEDTDDGEPFEISAVSWDGTTLRFTSRMPSTGHVVEHEFVVLDRGRVRHRFWIVEVWVRA